MKKILRTQSKALAVSALLFGSITTKAQFTITENFRNNVANNNIIVGGDPSAYLTSGKDDPQGNGWLRLTKATSNQKGFAYIDKSFPSTLGVFVDFEFKAWRTKTDGVYGGADGFSVFLFDADATFKLGGNGGSLGYAPNTSTPPVTPTGLAGGYVGIGLDEYGNFSNPSEGRIGGPGLKPNSIVLRGPTTNNASTTNMYLAGHQLATNVYDYNNDGIDYDGTFTRQYNWYTHSYDTTRVFPTSRPNDNTYYRRIQISIVPNNGKYDVTVKMAKTPGGAFTQYISYTTTTPPPANLKLGFAASTGGGFNYHDIRNLYVTTPGGVRVDKSVDKTSATVGSHLVYTINAYNATTASLTGLALKDTLYDGSNVAGQDAIRLDSFKFDNHGNPGNNYTPEAPGDPTKSTIGATLNMGASTSASGDAQATFTVYATVLKAPASGSYTNKVSLELGTSGITDDDLTNNSAEAVTKIIETDLSVTATHAGDFHAGDQNKDLTIHVTNNGPDATGTTTTVTDTLPDGFTYAGITGDQGNGWIVTVSDNIVTAVYNGSVASGSNFPDLSIPVNIAANVAGQTLIDKAGVQNDADDTPGNNNAEDDILIGNNTGLPIILSSFTGSRTGGSNVLNWVTSSEINNKGFELQRSVDNGKTWIDVVFKTGNGTSAETNYYTYSDKEGAAYSPALYKLIQYDLDGKSTPIKDIVSIQGPVTTGMALYPNPATSNLNISLQTGQSVTNGIVKIIAVSGAIVKTVSVNGQNLVTIPVSNLLKGNYFVQIISNGKVLYNGHFIKE